LKIITIYDIAKEANISVATVSRVLNNTAPVKESTRERINRIIDKYHFQPNALARSLTKKETGMIGIILPDITNPFFPEVFSGAENEARELGYTIFLCNTLGDCQRESEYLNILREKRVDGVLFMGGRINMKNLHPDLVKEVVDLEVRMPIVLVNGDLAKSNLTRVFTDEVVGAELATQHLIDLGHKDIGFIGGIDYMTTTIQKIKSFKKTLERNNLSFNENWLLYDSFSIQSGRNMMTKLLEMNKKPTAVICINDFVAIGAIKSALEHGVKIPKDISIVGFDDTLLATAVIPELTTVSQQSHELGKTAVQVLHKLINKEKVKKLTILAPELIVRDSSGHPAC
jgi:LacI family transcriptional regulator